MNPTVKLALDICTDVKYQITSSDDIISRSELPSLTPAMFSKFFSQYGIIAEEYMRHLRFPSRNAIRNPQKMTALGANARLISSLACAEKGIGECEESADLASFLLLKKGYHNFVRVMIYGRTPDAFKGLCAHTFLILNPGPIDNIEHKISALDMLSDDAIVLDPLLKHVGHANQYRQDAKNYLRHFNYEAMTIENRFSELEASSIPLLEKKVKQYLKQFTALPVYQSNVPLDKNVIYIPKRVKIFDINAHHSSMRFFKCQPKEMSKGALLIQDESLDWESAMTKYQKQMPN